MEDISKTTKIKLPNLCLVEVVDMFNNISEMKKALDNSEIVKVVCINNKYDWKGRKMSYQLTEGRVYEAVLVSSTPHYVLVNDTQQIKFYLTKLFKPLRE